MFWEPTEEEEQGEENQDGPEDNEEDMVVMETQHTHNLSHVGSTNQVRRSEVARGRRNHRKTRAEVSPGDMRV